MVLTAQILFLVLLPQLAVAVEAVLVETLD
jgi:hypothetical protein